MFHIHGIGAMALHKDRTAVTYGCGPHYILLYNTEQGHGPYANARSLYHFIPLC